MNFENQYKQYLFYDLETSGTNPSFDQILQFAGVKTDLSFNEIERYDKFQVKNSNMHIHTRIQEEKTCREKMEKFEK